MSSSNSNSQLRSYALKRITDFLDSENYTYSVHKHSRYDTLYASGCYIEFPESNISLSVQTNPSIAGSSFCESALGVKDRGVVYIQSLGYSDVVRHDDLENFVDHIRDLKTKVENRNADSFNDFSDDPRMSDPVGSMMSILSRLGGSTSSSDNLSSMLSSYLLLRAMMGSLNLDEDDDESPTEASNDSETPSPPQSNESEQQNSVPDTESTQPTESNNESPTGSTRLPSFFGLAANESNTDTSNSSSTDSTRLSLFGLLLSSLSRSSE